MHPLLPANAGLLYVFAAVAAVGGVAAAAQQSTAGYPSIWSVLQRAIVGAATGLGVGSYWLARFTGSDADVFQGIFYSLLGGFLGPYAFWDVWSRLRAGPNGMQNPLTPPPPPGEGK